MLSTYARLFIGFSESFSSLITEYSRQSQSKQTKILPITILSASQVSQALAHPQNQTLTDMIAITHSDNIKIDRKIIQGQESLDSQRIFIEETLNALESKKRVASPATKANIENTMNSLNQQYKLLNNIQNALDHGRKQMSSIKNDIDDLVQRQDGEWSAYRENFLRLLKQEIEKVTKEAGLPPIPQGEIDNLMRQDLQEVLDRFTDLGASKDLPAAELEKILGINNPDFDTYFKMKAYLALRSILPSRENIGELMKKLDQVFIQAKDEANSIYERQAAEIRTHDNDKLQPILKVAESNYETLTRLEIDREDLLKVVASLQDIESIREKTQQRIAEVRPTELKI